MPTDTFRELSFELDKESYDWLFENAPTIADAVRVAVGRGATAERVKQFVMQRCGRHELALRCQSAARYLETAKG